MAVVFVVWSVQGLRVRRVLQDAEIAAGVSLDLVCISCVTWGRRQHALGSSGRCKGWQFSVTLGIFLVQLLEVMNVIVTY